MATESKTLAAAAGAAGAAAGVAGAEGAGAGDDWPVPVPGVPAGPGVVAEELAAEVEGSFISAKIVAVFSCFFAGRILTGRAAAGSEDFALPVESLFEFCPANAGAVRSNSPIPAVIRMHLLITFIQFPIHFSPQGLCGPSPHKT